MPKRHAKSKTPAHRHRHRLADKIIFQFILNTTDNETKSIKIYSDYRIDFNTALVINPDIKLK